MSKPLHIPSSIDTSNPAGQASFNRDFQIVQQALERTMPSPEIQRAALALARIRERYDWRAVPIQESRP